jgi:hypothetical protein
MPLPIPHLRQSFEDKLSDVSRRYRALVPSAGERIDPAALVQGHWDRSDFQLCQGELFQFELFAKHLHDVKGMRPDVFEAFKAKLYQCATADNYYGLRMEANIASTLARGDMPFEFQDRPDFSVQGGAIYIECGSVWPDTSDRERDYRERVASTIRKKSRKRYATPKTVLAIEITSVLAAMTTHHAREVDTDFNQFLAALLNGTDFGAVLLFSIVYSHETGILHSAYVRFDSPRMDSSLLGFMNTQFPMGSFRVFQPFAAAGRTPFTVYRATYRNVPRSGEAVIDLPLKPFMPVRSALTVWVPGPVPVSGFTWSIT